MELKKLSLVQLERGLQLLQVLDEEGTATEMVAVYLASPGQVHKSKSDAAALDGTREDARSMPGEEAAGILADFFEQCVRFRADTLGSLPKITEEIKAKVLAAQSPTS